MVVAELRYGCARSAKSAANRAAVDALLQSVTALKPGLDVVASTDRAGHSVSELVRLPGATVAAARTGTAWSQLPEVSAVLADNGSSTAAGFGDMGGMPVFIVAAAICDGPAPCHRVGASITGQAVRAGEEQD